MGENDLKKQLGTSVKAWRSQRGISQEELAKRSGLHRSYVSGIERGLRNITLECVERLAEVLKVSVATLFTHFGPMTVTISPGQLVEILLIEDNSDDVMLTTTALTDLKVANHLRVLRDGAEALHYLFCTGPYASRKGQKRPQVVFLDLDLPKVSGLEILRRMRADATLRTTPVIILTASRYNSEYLNNQKLAADGYIVKPLDFRALSDITPKLNMYWALLNPQADAYIDRGLSQPPTTVSGKQRPVCGSPL